MKTLPSILAALLLAGCLLPASAASSTVTPTRLRTEYLVDPLGLDVARPRLDWLLDGSAETPRQTSQRAYRILVASSLEKLALDQGDLWDSGVVASDETTQIPYAGSALPSRQACFWKVQITDNQGLASSWSQPARWEMGLLQPADWQARWIDGGRVPRSESSASSLTIDQAFYENVDGSESRDVTSLVRSLLKDNALSLPVTRDFFSDDPALRRHRQLRVLYSFDGATRQAVCREKATLSLPEDQLPCLRKDFTLAKPIARARVYVTALGLYELRLNGQRVGDHFLAPDWTDYRKRVRYQVYDVTSLLQPGANTLGALLADGWYSGHVGFIWFQFWGKTPALLAQLEVTYADGTIERIVSDASWKVHSSPILSSDMLMGETCDARQDIAAWDRPGLSTSGWAPAVERSESVRSLDAQVSQPVRQTAEIQPRSVSQPRPGHFVYDLGQNMVGIVRLRVTAPAGTVVAIRHAEMLNPDGTMYTTNLRSALATDTYICKGGGEEVWRPAFTFHGFRYVELTGLPQSPDLKAVTGLVIGTDIPRTGAFTCSDPDTNQLQSNIQWGMRGNYLSVPTDCPQRDERLGWMGDAQVFIRTAAYNGDIAAFFTKWMTDVTDAQTPDGAFTDISPNLTLKGGTPGWGDAGVICPWTIYLMYGDRRLLEQSLPAMKKWVDYCQTHSTNLIRDGNRGSDYGDWLSQQENAPKDLLGTAYFAYSASLVAQACQVVGDTQGAAQYGQLFDRIKAAFLARYVTAEGRISDGSQTSYALALRFHLLPEDIRPQAVGFLADNVAKHGDHLTTGFLGVSYLLPALSSGGSVDPAYRLFQQTTFPSWLFSVRQGATTIWERWDGWTPEHGFFNPSMNSFNHYSLGSCGEWMFDTVAGIGLDPEHPGFKHLFIQPRPGGTLTRAEAAYDSIHGRIATKWTLDGAVFSLDVTIPVNVTATVSLPPTLSSLREGERDVAACPDLKSLPSADRSARFLVGSGTYHFTGRFPQ